MGLNALCIYFLILGINVLFFHIINVPNLYGRQVSAVLEGFRQYLSGANILVEDERELDEKVRDKLGSYLPWAIALEADSLWISHFRRILKELDENAPYSQDIYPWRHYKTLIDPGAVTAMTTQISSAVITAPGTDSVSASSGGGVSGGGGGGGGGTGW